MMANKREASVDADLEAANVPPDQLSPEETAALKNTEVLLRQNMSGTEAALRAQPTVSVFVGTEHAGRATNGKIRVQINSVVTWVPLGQEVDVPESVAAVLSNARML
jgi:hypothetical protein